MSFKVIRSWKFSEETKLNITIFNNSEKEVGIFSHDWWPSDTKDSFVTFVICIIMFPFSYFVHKSRRKTQPCFLLCKAKSKLFHLLNSVYYVPWAKVQLFISLNLTWKSLFYANWCRYWLIGCDGRRKIDIDIKVSSLHLRPRLHEYVFISLSSKPHILHENDQKRHLFSLKTITF